MPTPTDQPTPDPKRSLAEAIGAHQAIVEASKAAGRQVAAERRQPPPQPGTGE